MRIGKGVASGWGYQNWKGGQPGRGLWGLKHSWWVLICLVYIISPIDAIPDFIPVLGQMDDLGILVFLAFNLWQWISGLRSSEGAAGERGAVVRSAFDGPVGGAEDGPVVMSTFEVQVTDQSGAERWVEVAAMTPDEARRSVAAGGNYVSVGRVRRRAA